MQKLTRIIFDHIPIKHANPANKLIYKAETNSLKNEFLLILKPELFANTTVEEQIYILDLISRKLDKYHLHVGNIRFINAGFLIEHKIIDEHYGVINSAARDIQKTITPEAKQYFKQFYNETIDRVKIYGAIEILERGIITAKVLSELWKDCEIKRLGSGIYCGKVKYKEENLYIINGFHPPQLQHFIDKDRYIITMNIGGNGHWSVARKELVGNTYPEKADPESIRGALFSQFDNFGFDNVSYVLNSVHLSAGPLEGLIELLRFNSTFEKNEKAELTDFSFGRLLLKNFTREECEFMLSNPTVKHEGHAISLFDLTEEMDSDKAIAALKNCTFI